MRPFVPRRRRAGERVFVVTTEGVVFTACRGPTVRSCGTSGAMPSARAFFPMLVRRSRVTSSSCLSRAATSSPYGSPTVRRCGRISFARTRTASSLTAMSDAARPAIDGGTVFAVGHAGRMIAVVAQDGRAAVVAHGAEHPGTLRGRQFRVCGRHRRPADGNHAPRRQNPMDRQASRRRDLVGAGAGRQSLWLASSKGQLVGVEAKPARCGHAGPGTARVLLRPVVAGGRMYVLTDKARLVAFN